MQQEDSGGWEGERPSGRRRRQFDRRRERERRDGLVDQEPSHCAVAALAIALQGPSVGRHPGRDDRASVDARRAEDGRGAPDRIAGQRQERQALAHPVTDERLRRYHAPRAVAIDGVCRRSCRSRPREDGDHGGRGQGEGSWEGEPRQVELLDLP